jgi:hypothetical protein
MAALRSEDILLDHDALARALKAPRAPHFSGAPPMYRLEDRLPSVGPRGSVMPPTKRQLEAMTATYPVPKRGSSRGLVLGLVLLACAAATGTVVYRDMDRESPAASAAISER